MSMADEGPALSASRRRRVVAPRVDRAFNSMRARAQARVVPAIGRRVNLGVRARHVELSALASMDDEPVGPSDRLLDLAEAAIRCARTVSMEAVSSRINDGPRWPDVWPGEHYKLLAALVSVSGAKRVVEIGTFQGYGTLALREALPPDGRLTTFDVIPYREISGHIFQPADFADGRIEQVIADLTRDDAFARHRDVLRDADLVFADAAKDGHQERVFLKRFDEVAFTHAPVVIFDDIRVFNMLQIWRDVDRPKLDLTSFGHWSGTGLVDYA